MPLFSFVVPSYNSEKYLCSCIDSLLKQSFSDYEIVIVDDGSTDSSPEICDKYSNKNSNIQVIHTANRGALLARELGTQSSKGEYIIAVDCDDIVDKDLLRVLNEIIIEKQPDIVCYAYQDIDQSGSKGNKILNGAKPGLYNEINKCLLIDKLVNNTNEREHNMGSIIYSLWSKAIKRDIMLSYQSLLPHCIKNGDDLCFIAPAICSSKSIYVSDFVGYYYRRSDNSMNRTFRETELLRISRVVKFLLKYACGVPYNNIAAYAYYMVLGQTALAADNYKSYKSFRVYINKYIDDSLWKCINDFQQHNLKFKSALSLFLIKKHNWLLFWLFCKLSH